MPVKGRDRGRGILRYASRWPPLDPEQGDNAAEQVKAVGHGENVKETRAEVRNQIYAFRFKLMKCENLTAQEAKPKDRSD